MIPSKAQNSILKSNAERFRIERIQIVLLTIEILLYTDNILS